MSGGSDTPSIKIPDYDKFIKNVTYAIHIDIDKMDPKRKEELLTDNIEKYKANMHPHLGGAIKKKKTLKIKRKLKERNADTPTSRW